MTLQRVSAGRSENRSRGVVAKPGRPVFGERGRETRDLRVSCAVLGNKPGISVLVEVGGRPGISVSLERF